MVQITYAFDWNFEAERPRLNHVLKHAIQISFNLYDSEVFVAEQKFGQLFAYWVILQASFFVC